MMEDRLGKLLQETDRRAGPPARVRVNLSEIRRRASRRRLVNIAGPLAVAAVLVVALGIWIAMLRTDQTTPKQDRIASLEIEVKQLQARADAAMSLIQQMLEDERRRQRIDELEAQLASIPDPLEELQKQVDRTAYILIYQADRLYKELNQTDSAVEDYNRVIELFPENRWANVARERLKEIENRKPDQTDLKGDIKWKPKNVSSSC